MTDNELRMIAEILDEASDRYSNHGCYDIDEELLYKGWSDEEKTELCRYGNVINNSIEEYNNGDIIESNWWLMYVLSQKIKGKLNDRKTKV